MLPLLLAASLALGAPPASAAASPDPAAPWRDQDWAAVGRDTARLLSGYLRVDTVNPPGNETAGARFLADWLQARGIQSEVWEYAPGRGSLVARVAGTGQQPPLCLLSHIDVATAEEARWPQGKGPLSGTIDAQGDVWGRGALDMKGMGAVEAMVLALAANSDLPLSRDLVLLAVADEEVDNRGIQHVISRWDEIGCSHVVNEGGVGIADMLFPGQTVHPISVGEKGVLWARLVASGEPGHGSVPQPDQAPERLARAAQALLDRQPKPTWDPALLELLHNIGAHQGGAAGFVLQRPGLVKLLVRGRLMGNPLTRAGMTDTAHVTGFGGAEQPNVVPSTVWANVDSRLLPGTTPDAMVEELVTTIDDPNVQIEVLQRFDASVSPWADDPFYQALAARAVQGDPNAVAGPVISVGFTDSILLRPLGVRAYGFVPFVVTAEELATMHGDGEHVSIENLRRGVRVLWNAVLDVSVGE
ncbi:M20/M25/M40 family metallo-hydrolase [Myxococcota bacterium]|nr:M20/M25/M40 family metallo-hydrolase [Myxococcota bacterium]